MYVKFEDEVEGKMVVPGWNVANMQNGVYCIVPKLEYWHLDANSGQKHMKISRRQLPIVPNFARTAYSLQGWTLPAGKVDLNLSKSTDPVTGYVALSRFKRADDVLILQPFPLQTFQQGAPEQPEILLLYLYPEKREEALKHVHELEARLQDERLRKKQKTKEARTANLPRECKQRARKHPRELWACSTCGEEKDYTGYSEPRWLNKRRYKSTVCELCEQKKPKEQLRCFFCKQEKDHTGYDKKRWNDRKRIKKPRCLACEDKTLGL